MNLPTADAFGGTVTRRQALQWIGGAGLTATVGACTDSPTEITAATTPSAGSTQQLVPTSTSSASPIAKPTPTVLLCRDSWGARPARPGGRAHTVSRLTLHHSGIVLGDNTRAVSRLRQHQRYHQDSHGWIDIAYHLSVDRNGHIYELRTPKVAGDTATDYDTTGHFLVVCEGDFDQEAITPDQISSTAMAFAWASQTFGVSPQTLAGHRDFASTACPGKNLYEHLSSGDLERRIDLVLAGGGVDLQRR